MLEIYIVLLAIATAVILFKWVVLKNEIKSITRSINRSLDANTNEQITVGTQNKHIMALARAINALYDHSFCEREEHIRTMNEVRQIMENVSHDLRTPLTSVLGYVSLLQSGDATLKQQTHYLSVINKNTHHLHELIESLFEFSRLESGSYQFELERINANELLTEDIAGYYEELTKKDPHPSISLCDAPLWMIGDKTALSRIFSNLMQNMVLHGTHSIRIASRLEKKQIILVFANRTEELKPEDVDKIFGRSFVGDYTRGSKSTGLGLSIVKEFVKQLNGTIHAEMKKGILTFTLRFPYSS